MEIDSELSLRNSCLAIKGAQLWEYIIHSKHFKNRNEVSFSFVS